MNYTPLYYHKRPEATFQPRTLMPDEGERHIMQHDEIRLESGETIGWVAAISLETRKLLEAEDGVTVLPPLHRPIRDHHVAAFGHAGAVAGDTGYDVAEKLHATHGMKWLHPEHRIR